MENIVIVGAGISGLVFALLMARLGHSVSVYDKRIIFDEQTEGRSINFTISGRGLAVLEKLGLKELVLADSVVLVGRLFHLQNAKHIRYKYGTKKSQVLLSIRRSKLIEILLNAVTFETKIHLHFGFELINIDDALSTYHFLNVNNKQDLFVKADWIIGADGVFSTVRSFMLKKQMSSYQQTIDDWGYKEYQFDAKDAKKLRLSLDHMHMWPKENGLLVAIPNTDNTFSVIYTAPLRDSNGKLNHLDALVKHECHDIVHAASSFFNNSGVNPFNYIVSIQVDKWHLDDKIILMGDACHATYPFYGQGMNSALEDAVLLSNYLNDKSLTRFQSFLTYENSRKKDTNALHQLSKAHLQQMIKKMISPFGQACHMLDYQIAKLLPGKWVYEYEIVAHSTLSYITVLEVIKKQNSKKKINGFFLMAFLLSFFIKIKE